MKQPVYLDKINFFVSTKRARFLLLQFVFVMSFRFVYLIFFIFLLVLFSPCYRKGARGGQQRHGLA